ncbi:DUF4199 domain-containing protein [Leadbetterella sp. DM7]|uniref:DUF4199 domain-containing protein n=1 Tax=Leadbetterella sp. DM7 TaxID=3235085 RepID=UPI00349EF19C
MNRLVKNALIFGTIAGVTCFLFFLVLYGMSDNPLSLRRPDLGINIIFIGSAIWYYKRSNNGYLHFYEGFSIGFLTNILAALITGVLIFLFLQFIDGQPLERWMTESRQMLIADRARSKDLMSEETFQTLLDSFGKKRPSVVIGDELLYKQLAVVAVTLFSMAMRKIKPL